MRILVDTSVWIDHFRVSDPDLVHLLQQNLVCGHPWVTGELACGNLTPRASTIQMLMRIPQVLLAREAEVLLFIDTNHLMGRGVGYIDMHLLASARLNRVSIWTRDKRLGQISSELQIAYLPQQGLGFPI